MAEKKCTCCGALRIEPSRSLRAIGMQCAHGFVCDCMERRVCVACDRCERHCKCEQPELRESYVQALAGMRAELAGERTAREAWQRVRLEEAA